MALLGIQDDQLNVGTFMEHLANARPETLSPGSANSSETFLRALPRILNPL